MLFNYKQLNAFFNIFQVIRTSINYLIVFFKITCYNINTDSVVKFVNSFGYQIESLKLMIECEILRNYCIEQILSTTVILPIASALTCTCMLELMLCHVYYQDSSAKVPLLQQHHTVLQKLQLLQDRLTQLLLQQPGCPHLQHEVCSIPAAPFTGSEMKLLILSLLESLSMLMYMLFIILLS